MLLSEYLENNDLFGAIENIKPYGFITELSPIDLSFNYGQRTMSSSVVELTVESIAGMIVSRFGGKWDNLLSIDLSTIKLDGSDNEITLTTTSKNGTKNDNTTTINKISGYNDDELIVENGNDVDLDVVTEDNEIRNSSKYKQNLKSLFDNLSLVDKTNIITTVQRDISNFITLSIY